jgi:hypothetical protein
MAQLRASLDHPLLSVGDRQGPLLRARKEHGRRGRPDWGVTAVVTHLNRRVRPVLDDHCLVGKRPKAARQKAFGLGRRSPLRHWSG